MSNHGIGLCGVQTHDPEIARQTPYPSRRIFGWKAFNTVKETLMGSTNNPVITKARHFPQS